MTQSASIAGAAGARTTADLIVPGMGSNRSAGIVSASIRRLPGVTIMRRQATGAVALVLGLALVLAAGAGAGGAESKQFKTGGGLAVYLGVLPAAMIQGHPRDHPEEAMHGGVPSGRHAYHVMAAVFDAATGERVEDAVVEARVAEPGLAGVMRRLEPMLIAGTVTYGNYFTLRGDGPYRIIFSITRADAALPVVLEFSYGHRTR
jgi:hypothetical protein